MKGRNKTFRALSLSASPNDTFALLSGTGEPPVPFAPINIVPPLLTGNGAVETIVYCSSGDWDAYPAPTYEYRFFVDGVLEQASASNELLVLEIYADLEITAVVIATNSEGNTPTTSSNSILAGFAPVNTVEPSITPTGTQVTGVELTCSEGTWDGTAPLTYDYQWMLDGLDITGETNSTYTIQASDDGSSISCKVRGNNAYGTSAYVTSSNSVDAVNAVAPVNTVAPIVSGTAVVGQNLTTTNGTWTGTPSPTFSYQWYRGATPVGTNSNTYTLVQADAGNTSNIKCTVTATNVADSVSSDSNTIAQILTFRTNAFLAASSISDATIRGALNNFDIGLISNSLDTKMKAVYPFVGGTAATHKFNFMNSADTDAAFRLTFSGTWTHSATGGDPNGVNAFANTFLSPSSILTLNSLSMGYYSRQTASTIAIKAFMGSFVGLTQETQLITNVGGATTTMFDSYNITANQGRVSGTIASYLGLIIASRQSSTSSKIYKNGSSFASISGSGGTQPNIPIYLSAGNLNGTGASFTDYECAFAFIGDGLTDTDASNYYTLVQAFQTTLGRQV
jgi:hypothetical protein